MKIVETIRYGARGQGALIKFEGSAHWYSRHFARGKEHVESTGTSDLKRARRFHRQKLDEIAADRQGLKKFVTPSDRRLTVDEALDALVAKYKADKIKSMASVKSHLKPIREYFGRWRASEVSAPTVRAYINNRLETKKAAATINRETQLLGQAFRLAEQDGRLSSVPPMHQLAESKPRSGFFEREAFEALVAALPEYLRDVARFGYCTGWRRSEILGLTADNVKMKLGELRIGDSKSGEGRVIPLRNEEGDLNAVGEIVERRMAQRRVGDTVVPWLFHHNGRPIADFRKAWFTACTAAKVPGALFHDLRRTFCHDAAEAGADYKTIMDWTGHKTTSTFLRYRIVSLDGMRRAAGRVADYRQAQDPRSSA